MVTKGVTLAESSGGRETVGHEPQKLLNHGLVEFDLERIVLPEPNPECEQEESRQQN